MRMIHDPAVRKSIEERLMALRPDAPRQWGSMTPDQMLWHINQFLAFSLGDATPEAKKNPIPPAVLRFFLLYMPWPKGAPTHKNARPTGNHDFAAERERCLALIERFVSKPIEASWPSDPAFGEITGLFASRLQARHFDHHLRQFNC